MAQAIRKDQFKQAAEQTAAAERAIQKTIDRKDKTSPQKKKGAMQAGERIYPEPPLPAQHLAKPGNEADLSEGNDDVRMLVGAGRDVGWSAPACGAELSRVGPTVNLLELRSD